MWMSKTSLDICIWQVCLASCYNNTDGVNSCKEKLPKSEEIININTQQNDKTYGLVIYNV